jgi:hypothetical protein
LFVYSFIQICIHCLGHNVCTCSKYTVFIDGIFTWKPLVYGNFKALTLCHGMLVIISLLVIRSADTEHFENILCLKVWHLVISVSLELPRMWSARPENLHLKMISAGEILQAYFLFCIKKS